MGFLQDWFLGSRPDYRMMPGMDQYVHGVQDAGTFGKPLSVKYAKQDLQAAGRGEIENMRSLQPVLAAIRAQGASDYDRADAEMRKEMAFTDDPSLRAAMLGEISGRINQNQGRQFAEASSTAYDRASG